MSRKSISGLTRVQTIIIVVIVIIAVALGGYLYAPLHEGVKPAPKEKFALAAIFPGTISDADYNTLGYVAITEVQRQYGIKIAYSENVAVPDVERVVREYISAGYNVIWTHGGQFFSATKKLAGEHPNIYFIGEFDGPVENAPKNLWWINRNFYVGFYVLGALAGMITKTGKIGYIGGLTLPFSYAEVNAVRQALKEYNPDAKFAYVWAGDFNDPVKGRELTEAIIAEGADVILGSLNLGMLGVFEAAKKAETKVYVTAKYTDKSSFAPDNYVTAELVDFSKPLLEIVKEIMDGKTGRMYGMDLGKGIDIQFPLKNVPAEVENKLKTIIEDIKAGKTEVIKDVSKPP